MALPQQLNRNMSTISRFVKCVDRIEIWIVYWGDIGVFESVVRLCVLQGVLCLGVTRDMSNCTQCTRSGKMYISCFRPRFKCWQGIFNLHVNSIHKHFHCSLNTSFKKTTIYACQYRYNRDTKGHLKRPSDICFIIWTYILIEVKLFLYIILSITNNCLNFYPWFIISQVRFNIRLKHHSINIY